MRWHQVHRLQIVRAQSRQFFLRIAIEFMVDIISCIVNANKKAKIKKRVHFMSLFSSKWSIDTEKDFLLTKIVPP